MNRSDWLLALLQELGQEERSRREPEYIFSAAAIAAFGAIAWGVATIATVTGVQDVAWFRHPALFAAAGCGLLAWAVIARINREHSVYRGIREEQVRVSIQLAESCGVSVAEIPRGLRSVDCMCGRRWSNGLVFVAALSAIAFCVSVWWLSKKEPISKVQGREISASIAVRHDQPSVVLGSTEENTEPSVGAESR